jgi:DinB superfamily
MRPSQINPMPEYFDHYINLVADIELSDAFDDSIRQLNEVDKDLLTRLDSQTYAPDKWTVKEILQHVIDFERILSYRGLLFARSEGSIPQSIDQHLLAKNSLANERTIDSQIEELKSLRLATKALYDSFDNHTLLNMGINWKYEISVLALGFAMIGHQIHHLKVIEEKYYPLLQKKQNI